GIRLAILSSGLDLLAARVARDLGCAVWAANELGARDGYLDGRVRIRVGWHGKPARLPWVCRKLGVRPHEVAVVGDGAGDALLFDRVGLAVAFNPADEEVARRADVVVRGEDLRAVLPVLLEHLAPEAGT
ncbi:MAG: HAD hydrolase family protein, partial [Firmicutes bacterium]|nr:HAD hydrolase family protein [Bacillota bacterium]